MRYRTSVFAALLMGGALILGACQSTGGAAAGPPCAERPIAEWVEGDGTCLSLATFGTATPGTAPTLVVVLHGDVSRGGAADYHVPYAREVGEAPNTVAVAMVRPGYPDGRGASSGGSNNRRRDHYTATNNAIVAGAVRALKAAYEPERTILIAHSGGAAQAGAIIGRFPGIADAAILVSCPCDVPRWRRMRGRSAWTNSQSPDAFADDVPPATTVVAITGDADGNTDPSLARDYVESLSTRGLDARFVAVQGAGHGFDGLWPTVRDELAAMR